MSNFASNHPGSEVPETNPVAQPSDQRGAASALRWLRETVTLVVTALVLATLLKMFLIQTFYIPTGSMLETLQVNDRVMVEKISYVAGDPKRGDVIVFRRPGLQPDGLNPLKALQGLAESVHLVEPEPDRDLIKRIIGLPGEEVSIVDGVTYINGDPLQESYINFDGGNFGPYFVPEGHYFMMGDNRPNSLDSRFDLGFVPRENIIGKAFTIVWPADHARWGLSANAEYGQLAESSQTTADGTSGS